jgi:LmbE family N-acetylglucosaminyl deacetylase
MHRRTVLTAAALGLAAAALPGRAAALTTSPALFVAAHPDDETLAMSTTTAEHVAAGQDVHVLWMTDGEATGVINPLNGTGVNSWWGVQHVPAAEGYATLTAADVATARVLESTTAVRCLSAGLSGSLTMHRAQLPDGGVTAASAHAAILAVCDLIAPGAPVRLKGHSHIVDNHPDHLAVGNALVSLSSSDPARFSDRRHYILPGYWSDSRLSQVAEAWDYPASADITARVRNAIRSYGAWAPSQGAYAIGYHSTAGWFDQLDNTPKSMFHP